MGRPYKTYLNAPRVYSCATCRAHAADHDEIISKVPAGTSGGGAVVETLPLSLQLHALPAPLSRPSKAVMDALICSTRRKLMGFRVDSASLRCSWNALLGDTLPLLRPIPTVCGPRQRRAALKLFLGQAT